MPATSTPRGRARAGRGGGETSVIDRSLDMSMCRTSSQMTPREAARKSKGATVKLMDSARRPPARTPQVRHMMEVPTVAHLLGNSSYSFVRLHRDALDLHKIAPFRVKDLLRLCAALRDASLKGGNSPGLIGLEDFVAGCTSTVPQPTKRVGGAPSGNFEADVTSITVRMFKFRDRCETGRVDFRHVLLEMMLVCGCTMAERVQLLFAAFAPRPEGGAKSPRNNLVKLSVTEAAFTEAISHLAAVQLQFIEYTVELFGAMNATQIKNFHSRHRSISMQEAIIMATKRQPLLHRSMRKSLQLSVPISRHLQHLQTVANVHERAMLKSVMDQARRPARRLPAARRRPASRRCRSAPSRLLSPPRPLRLSRRTRERRVRRRRSTHGSR